MSILKTSVSIFSVALAIAFPAEAGRHCGWPAISHDAGASSAHSSSRDLKTSYCFKDLGTLPGDDYSYATAINDRGQVVGQSGNSQTQNEHAFIYSQANLLMIPPLSGDNAIAVTDINESAYVVGNSVDTRNFTGNNPLIYRNGLTNPIDGIHDAIPYAINNFSTIVGGQQGFGGFVTRNGKVTYLESNTIAYDVNNGGDVVGMTADEKAFIYRHGKLIEIGTVHPEDRQSAAYGVNDRSEVVGYSAQESIDDGQAFFYRKRTGMVGLGRLKDNDAYSVAVGVNDCGHVVGFSGSNFNFYDIAGLSAFIFANGRMTDLNAVAATPSGVTITAASQINNRGQIVGRGSINGRLHALLLTPKHDRQRCGEPDDEEWSLR